ncbi:uncharacterized protein DUF4136 [Luteimonas cucumeris]|uniref:Uncharacterized protein DUF4136 n=1 Tax=Luteimonas cucumeris TaxID=985012 RepID=A0A562LBF0_9GAMM|nr:DUF4136 domain-containing protein [Luteimonas cucumeris]TWI04961.1 uncharacterized protein DUF4136 [Luteimonas cucumeris]
MKRLALLMLPLLLSACASTPTTTTDVSPSADFSNYRSYSWLAKPDVNNPLAQQRIVDGINAQLRAKGWTESADGDVAVAAHVATSQKQTLDTFYSGGMYGGWGWRGGMGMGTSTTRVHTYDVGTLVVDMFDAKTKQGIWRGTASGTVPDSPEKANAAIDAGIAKMFAEFPPGSAPAGN